MMKHILISAVALIPAWSAANAQDADDLRVRVGLGAQLHPEYVGADGTSVGPLFHVNTARGTNEFGFGAPDDSPSIALLSTDGFSFGPAGNIEGRRKESDVGAPVGSVSRTFEAGAFAQYVFGDSFRIRAELLKGINGHEGLVGELAADKVWRDGDRYVVSIGPRVIFSDSRYQRAYFGVSPAASLASGLPEYRPSGGVHGVAAASGVSYSLNDRWGLFGFARYERLVGDAAKSPIVRDLGSRNQLSGGIGLNYTFTIRR
ncbi:MAG TPA: MipA/OmpV family protein [Sphingomicrobium sp.]